MKRIYLIFFISIMSSAVFGQSGTRLIGFDALSLGRAGTTIGFFDTQELMMTNPAGISFLNGSVVTANFSLMAPKTHFQNSLNDKDGDNNLYPMPSAGYVNKYKNKDSKFTWGVGFYTQGGMGADFSLKNELYRSQLFNYNPSDSTYYPVKGDYSEQSYHSKFAAMNGGLSAAYKFTDNFSAGFTAQAVYSLMEMKMPFGLNPSIMKGSPNGMPNTTFGAIFSAPPQLGGFGYSEVIASADMKELNVISFGGKLGLAWKPNDKLSFGVNYSLPTTLTYKNGKATMDMTKQFEDAMGRSVMGFYSQPGTHGVPLDTAFKYIGMNFYNMGIDLTKGMQANYDLEVGLKLPQSIGFGMSYAASPKVRVGFDFEFVNWKDAFDKMTITLTNGNNPNINKMMGSTEVKIDFPLNWDNSVLVKVGGEFDVSKPLTLRAGYAYGSNPVPAATVFPIFPAIVENHITFGGSYRFTNKIMVNFAFETALNKSLTANNPSSVQSEFSSSVNQLSTILGHLSFQYNF